MSDKGKSMPNSIAERVMRTLKDKYVDFADDRDFPDAPRQAVGLLHFDCFSVQFFTASHGGTSGVFRSP